jgi:nitroreductase
MDIIETINSRKSVRTFRVDPVPRGVPQSIMESALRAPSSSNSQPWEFAIVSGQMLEKVKAALVRKAESGEAPKSDFPWPTIEGLYRERVRRHGKRFFQHVGMARGDTVAMRNWNLAMTRFFDAPNGVIVYIDGSFSDWSLIDIGVVLAHVMLVAWHYGVGTCVIGPVAYYPEVLHRLLGIPESKRIIVGMAMGYPDFSSPLMQFSGEREPLAALVTRHGFD